VDDDSTSGWLVPTWRKNRRPGKDLIAASRAEMGPSRAEIPMQRSLEEMDSALVEATGMAALRAKEYFESGEFQNYTRRVGEFVDTVVLGSGDQVARAAENAGRVLMTGARNVQLQVRDALDGSLKEE
jgi:hypothetical protein